jgi:nucleoside-diphosphate-sugar epimerase
MKILITGGNGFIGSHLASRLSRNNKITIADISKPKFLKNTNCDVIIADLRSYKKCLNISKDQDLVFHLAANMGGIGFITSVFSDIMYDNLQMNSNMLKASAINNVKQFFYSSSACVYPEHLQTMTNVTPLAEDMATPANPDTYYGWEKLASEKMCEAYSKDYDMDVKVARFHAIYGPFGTYKGGREKAPAALCRKVILASNPGKIEIWGDGEAN